MECVDCADARLTPNMSNYKILISDKVADICQTYLQEKGFEVDAKPGLSPEALCETITEYHGIIVRSATKVTAEIIRSGKNLKVIGRAGAGIDNIDVTAATERGIAVVNAADGNTISVAEFTFALMLALSRHVPSAHISMLENRWERNLFKGIELYGKVLGIIGLGKIGQEVARRAQAFGMKTVAFDPLVESEVFESAHVEQHDLKEIFHLSDYVTVHVPLNKHTRNLIGAEYFENCKDGLRLINAARGGIVDEAALYRALKAGKLAGAAIDVFENEPPGGNPLIGSENVITTPHLGASTFEAQERVAEQIAEQVGNFLLTGTADSFVNPDFQRR